MNATSTPAAKATIRQHVDAYKEFDELRRHSVSLKQRFAAEAPNRRLVMCLIRTMHACLDLREEHGEQCNCRVCEDSRHWLYHLTTYLDLTTSDLYPARPWWKAESALRNRLHEVE